MFVMRAFLFLLLIFFSGVNVSFAYDLVLPKEKKSVVTSNYAHFVGRASNTESIIINDEHVYVASNGAFAHSVKLKDGENRVILKSNFKTQIYKFYKTPIQEIVKPSLIEFEPKVFVVKNDNTPLRKTPVDYGMNRLSHLFKGTKLIINGKKGAFYRVCLSKNVDAWISVDAVEETCFLETPPEFINTNCETFKNALVQKIEFTEKLPYTIEENSDGIVFRVYNPFYSENSVYTFNIRKPDKYYYKTSLQDGVYTFKVSEIPNVESDSLEGLTIVVDAGHGGTELGAIGCLGDEEKSINLAIAQELKASLCSLGANVVMTRECDGNVALDDRVSIARENNSHIFVSIHLNSIPDIKMNIHKNKGTTVYYYNQNSRELGRKVLESVTSKLGTRNDGLRTASFAVIRPTDYIGILVEVAYMINPNDSVMYKEDSFAVDTAKAITKGIVDFAVNK